MTIWKVGFFTAIVTFFKLVSWFVVAKSIALFAGVAAFGLFTQFQTFVNIAQLLAGGIINLGVVKYVSEYKDHRGTLDQILTTALMLVFFFSIIFCISMIVFSKNISLYIFHTKIYYHAVFVFSFIFVLFSVIQLALSMFIGTGEIIKYTLINLTNSLVLVCLSFFLVYKFKLFGAVYALILYPLPAFFIYFCWVKNLFSFKSTLQKAFSFLWVKKLLQFSMISLVTSISLPIAQFFLRNYVALHSSWQKVGYWQGVIKISDAYLLVFSTVIYNYAVPMFSRAKDGLEVKKYMVSIICKMLPLVVCSGVFVYTFKSYITLALFSKRFLPMVVLFKYQLIGDFCKITAWLFMSYMTSKARVLLTIGSEFLSVLCYVVLSVLFFNYYGVVGLTIAFAVTYALYLVYSLSVFLCCVS